MSETEETEDAFARLKARADALEQQLNDAKRQAASGLRQVELKSAALQAGIVDLDGLRLLDPAALSDEEDGTFDALNVVRKLQIDKPWLFTTANSSSVAGAPLAAPARKRLATDMSVEEWRAARAALLRRR